MKLLICEDDISTVDVIQSQLDCGEMGISRILRAYNGEAAIRIIEKERPEIILCDIGMPKVNGMEVLRYVHENRIETQFCFLTCHEDFEYAREAIRYGIAGYITKPFDMDELKAEILKMVFTVKSRQTQQPDAQARRDSVLNNVLRQISNGVLGTSREAVSSLLARNGLSISAASRWYMVLTCTDITDAVHGRWNRELLMYTIGRLHDEILADYIGSAYCLADFDGRFLQCTCFVPGETCEPKEVLSRCETLLGFCTKQIGVRPSVLAGPDFLLFQASAIRTEMAAKLPQIRVHAGRLFTMESVDSEQSKQTGLLDANQLLMHLKRFDSTGYREYITAVIRRIASSGNYTREVLDDVRRELIHIFTSCLRDNGVSSQMIFEDTALTELNGTATLCADNLILFAERLFLVTAEHLRALADADDIIAKADAYIREHFRENINREDVAAVACITPNYLSKQFHSKMGMNLREYINKIRVDEAKRLLLTTNFSVSEVAGMAGYDNISYFSTVFRKHTGMSPIDWRSAAEGDRDEA